MRNILLAVLVAASTAPLAAAELGPARRSPVYGELLAQGEVLKRELAVATAEDREKSKHVIDQHQALMWEVGDLIAQWEALQEHASASASES